MKLPSASSLWRCHECPSSHALPQARKTSEAAESGTIVHEFCRRASYGEKARAEALLQVPDEELRRCEAIDIEAILADFDRSSVLVEASYLINRDTGAATFSGCNLGRKYKHEDIETPGTADIIGKSADGTVWKVRDYKCGLWLGPPEESHQLRFFGLVLHKLYGAERVLASHCYIHHDGTHHIEECEFTEMDFDLALSELRTSVSKAYAAEKKILSGLVPDVNVGDWCKFCDAMHCCPYFSNWTHRMAEECGELVDTLEPIMLGLKPVDGTVIGRAWKKFKVVQKVSECVEDALKELINNFTDRGEAVPLPGGSKALRAVPSSRGRVNGKRALALLKSYGASDADVESCMGRTEFTVCREVKS